MRGELPRGQRRQVLLRRCLSRQQARLEGPIALEKLSGLLPQRRGLLLPGLAQLAQDPGQAGAAVAVLGREVGAGEEGFALRSEKHRQRPATALAEHLQRALIEFVEVGALLAVDLDVDEVLVHQVGDVRVGERLVGHHMAPVAGGIAHRQQDWLVLLARPAQGRLAPGVPVDRVLRVLAQIGRDFPG
ncbi:hypothetical protein FQZ97_1018270 [compost metagenome]